MQEYLHKNLAQYFVYFYHGNTEDYSMEIIFCDIA